MIALHQSLHNEYGLCLWTLLSVIIFAVMIVTMIIHFILQKKREESFEKDMENNRASSDDRG